MHKHLFTTHKLPVLQVHISTFKSQYLCRPHASVILVKERSPPLDDDFGLAGALPLTDLLQHGFQSVLRDLWRQGGKVLRQYKADGTCQHDIQAWM